MKYFKMFILFIIFIIFSIPGVISVSAEQANNPKPVQIFIKANEDYQKKNYNGAREKYEELLKQGVVNGHLYYNLGNCYTKLNNTGKAMVNYLRATELIPSDADLGSNISFLKKRLADNQEITDENEILKKVFFWNGQLNLEEHIIIFLVLWSLLFGFLLAKRYLYNDYIRLGIISFALLNFIFGMSFILKLGSSVQSRAVVLSQEANVKSSTDPSSITMFKVHEGTLLKVTEQTDKWSKIELTKDKRGWIQDSSIENL